MTFVCFIFALMSIPIFMLHFKRGRTSRFACEAIFHLFWPQFVTVCLLSSVATCVPRDNWLMEFCFDPCQLKSENLLSGSMFTCHVRLIICDQELVFILTPRLLSMSYRSISSICSSLIASFFFQLNHGIAFQLSQFKCQYFVSYPHYFRTDILQDCYVIWLRFVAYCVLCTLAVRICCCFYVELHTVLPRNQDFVFV